MLGKIGVDVGGRFLDAPVGLAAEFSEYHREQNDERRKAKHQKRQRNVQHEHCDQNAQNDEHVLHEVRQKPRKHHGNCARVVGYPRNEFSDRDFRKLSVRKVFDAAKEVFPQGRHDFLPRNLQQNGLNVTSRKTDQKKPAVDGNQRQKSFHFKRRLHDLLNFRHQNRRND